MSVKLLTEHHLEFLSLKGGCTGLSESTLVKMPPCWKSHVTAHFISILTPSKECMRCLGQTIPASASNIFPRINGIKQKFHITILMSQCASVVRRYDTYCTFTPELSFKYYSALLFLDTAR